MCGIIGYVGTKDATPILLGGLQALEYRGYDSAGLYMPGVGLTKSVGAVLNLVRKVGEREGGISGIAHTRWATHGPPTEANAHPHHDQDNALFLVHNGIIENYRELRDEMSAAGRVFYSDTDSEVLAQYIAFLLPEHKTLEEAVRVALTSVRGAYGIAVMEASQPERVIVARMGSPIVLGIAPHGHFVASDPSAFLAHTKEVIYLKDGEWAVITPDSCKVFDSARVAQERVSERIEWDHEVVEKGGFEHFMLKEIMEGPEVIRNTLRGRLLPEEGRAKLGGLQDFQDVLKDLKHLTFIGCGSAYYAGLVGKYLLEKYARIPVDADVASEFRYRNGALHTDGAVLAVSQSGETADTLASLREAKARGLHTFGVVNVVGSAIARETDAGVYNHAGPEVGVASTKAFISQITVLVLLSLYMGRLRGMSEGEGKEIVRALTLLPDQIQSILDRRDEIKKIAEKYTTMRDSLFIGRGVCMPIAFEGALKLKEVSYIHAEGYGAGEMKHGPIAMIDKDFPTIALVPQDHVYEKNISNIEEIRARSGPVIAIATEGDTAISQVADDVIFIPRAHEVVLPILATVPLQLFAYYVGTGKGFNVDRPRNLAKSVTVE